MLINLRNALMTWKRLPYDAEVEYLKSTGTQYILTGVPGGAARWEIGAKANSTTTQILVSMNRGANGGYYFGVLSGVWGFGGRGNNTTIAGTTYADINATIVGTGTSTATVNGQSCSRTQTNTIKTDEWMLFASSPTSFPFYGQIYYARCYQNGILVRDFIPVRKGAVGYLYDRVSGKLFGNAGTGDFVLGQDVVPVEYIESHGTEYIDTGFKASNSTRVAVDFELTNSIANKWILGARNGTVSATDKFALFYGNSSYAMIGSAMGEFSGTTIKTGRHLLDMSLAGGVVVDSQIVATYSASEQAKVFSAAYAMVLFNLWNGSLNSPFIGKYYACDFWDNGDPVRKFRPVRVGTDATSWEGAMMDVLTRRIYRNAGTGAFSYGNDLKYPIPA